MAAEFPNRPEYLASAITFSLVDVVVMFVIAVGIGRRTAERPARR